LIEFRIIIAFEVWRQFSRQEFMSLIRMAAAAAVAVCLAAALNAQSEKKKDKKDERVRTVTIPISIFTDRELKADQADEFIEAGEIQVKENKEDQTVLSIRSVTNTPLHLAVLIQDNLTGNVNLQLEDIKKFIRSLPTDSRVFVGYLRSGTTQVRQKFTSDLERAAKSIRIVSGAASLAPNSPYEGVDEVLDRFDALPTGRRAILVVSDGFDALDPSSPGSSADLDKAVLKAQRRSVAVYSIYSAGTATQGGGPTRVLNSQSSLKKLSDETGGRAFFQGTISPISFEPFFRDLNIMLNRQFALTYLSTHPKKGYYKVEVTSTNPRVRVEHPKGYYYRGR
jgi:VWFA-related protein